MDLKVAKDGLERLFISYRLCGYPLLTDKAQRLIRRNREVL